MARKSNKTAHVLNLLSGHDDKEKTETQKTEDEGGAVIKNESNTDKTDNKTTVAPQNISVIDKTEEDTLSQLIQDQLTKEVIEEPETVARTTIEPAPVEEESPVEDESPAEVESPAEAESLTEPEVPAEPESVEVPQKEPDFVVINVMEQVVKDKIIYFMRQFEVCTCDRCVADTIALTLNGLTPKYIVTTPAAADPLLSFYTNKFISDITVEATKACMIIKEHPRH